MYIAVAIILLLVGIFNDAKLLWPCFIIGVLISFISGLLCIKFLLKYIKSHDYNIFMWYRLGIALLSLIVLLFK